MAGKPKSSAAPAETKIRASSPTGSAAASITAVGALAVAALNTKNMKSDVRKAKAISKVSDSVANKFGASDETKRSIKDAVLSGGKNKSAVLKLGLAGIDKAFGSNLTGVANLGKDLFDLFDSSSDVIVTPPKIHSWSSLRHIRQRGDPLLSFDWRVLLPTAYTPEVAAEAWAVSNRIVNFYVEDVNITPRSINPEQVFRRGTYVNYPGWMDTGSLSLTFYEDNRMLVTRYLENWQRAIRGDNGLYGNPKDYKHDIAVYCLDTNFGVAGNFIAKRCWPTSRQGIALQSATSDPVKLTVDFATDGVIFIPNESWAAYRKDLSAASETGASGFFNLKSDNFLLNMMLQSVNKKGNRSEIGQKLATASEAVKNFKKR